MFIIDHENNQYFQKNRIDQNGLKSKDNHKTKRQLFSSPPFMNHLIFARKAYMTNFRPLVLFPYVKKFVVGGWVLKVDFSVKL